jgi:hypothetical protein
VAKEVPTTQLKEGETTDRRVTHTAEIHMRKTPPFHRDYTDFQELVEQLSRQHVSAFRTFDTLHEKTLFQGNLVETKSVDRLNQSGNYFIDADPFSKEDAEQRLEELESSLRTKKLNIHDEVHARGEAKYLRDALKEYSEPDEIEMRDIEWVDIGEMMAPMPKFKTEQLQPKIGLVRIDHEDEGCYAEWAIRRKGDLLIYSKKWLASGRKLRNP